VDDVTFSHTGLHARCIVRISERNSHNYYFDFYQILFNSKVQQAHIVGCLPGASLLLSTIASLFKEGELSGGGELSVR